MVICEKNRCTGCSACMAVCPKTCISMADDEKGFPYPSINDTCVECGLCQNVCPQNHDSMKYCNDGVVAIYAAFTKDKDIRADSSSGGIFSELAIEVIRKGGIIFASRFSEDQKTLLFGSCEDIHGLSDYMGSKYVQSHPEYIYKDVKKEVITGRNVMFVGTACQVAGLKAYLGKNYPNMLFVDIICHGVPSPKLWKDYLGMLEREYGDNAKDISFRYKKPSWTQFSLKVDFRHGGHVIKSKFDDPYLISFLKEISLRENCYCCPYTSTNRTGDITLADFWGYKSTEFKMRNTEKGISLVLVNTEKGTDWFSCIKDRINWTEKGLKEAMSGNRSLKAPWKKNENAEAFWNVYINEGNLDKALTDFCRPYRFPKKMKINWFILNHLYLVPKPILRKKGLL